jgi:hypothetical protein
VRPYEPNVVERALKAVETGGIPLITRDGIYAKLGSITTGSGFAYGAGYRSRRLFGSDAALDVWGGASLKGYWAGEARVRFPNLGGGRFLAEGGLNIGDRFRPADALLPDADARRERLAPRVPRLSVPRSTCAAPPGGVLL